MYVFQLNLSILKFIWMLIIKNYIIGLNYILVLKSFALWNKFIIFYKYAKHMPIWFEPVRTNNYALKQPLIFESSVPVIMAEFQGSHHANKNFRKMYHAGFA